MYVKAKTPEERKLIAMSKAKRLIAAALASVMCAASLTGCSDTTYAMEAGGKKINAGIYIYNVFTEMRYRNMMLYYQDGVTEDYFSQKIEGKDYSEYLEDYALKATKEYAAVVDKFDELGLKLSKEQLKELSDSVNEAWEAQGELLEYEGISKESVKLAQKASYMRQALFDHYYGEGGEEEVKASDIESYVNDNYMRYKLITISKAAADAEGAEETNAEAKEHFDEFSELAGDKDFTSFDEVIDAYNEHIQQEQAAAAEEASSGADSETDSAADSGADSTADSAADDINVSEVETEDANAGADDTSSVAEADALQGAEEGIEEGAAEEEELASSAADSETDSTADEDLNLSPDDLSADSEQTTEEDPYANEQMVNFTSIKKTYDENKDEKDYDDKSYKLNEFIYNMSAGEVKTYEDDNAYYIIAKGDITERAAKYAEENHDSLLQEMKGDEFQAKIDSWVEAIEFKINDKAIKRYTPKVVYDRQVDYAEKHQTEQ